MRVQEKDGFWRVIAYSAENAERIDTGTLATLHVERTAAGPIQVDFDMSRPLFAPSEENTGLKVGDPLRLD
jgi:hypothetical protein